jgi:VCBS repeat-containing protein
VASIHSDELQRGYPKSFQAFEDGWQTYQEADTLTYFAVQNNDVGNTIKQISAIGHGTTNASLQAPYDPGKAYFSKMGARIRIETTGEHAGTVSYDGALFDNLAEGETVLDSFTYALTLGPRIPTWTSVWITVTGTNDKPVVSGVTTGYSTEDGVTVSLDALAYASDIDNSHLPLFVSLSSEAFNNLPKGVYFDAFTQTFRLDASDEVFQSLALDQRTTVTAHYAVTDGRDTTETSVSWIVTGVNDAPIVSRAVTGTATEGKSAEVLAALKNTSDVDQGAILTVVDIPPILPPGVTFDRTTNNFTLDSSNAAYDHLAAGQHETVSVRYGVTDGIVTTAAIAAVEWTMTGSDDPASIEVVLAPGNAVAEDGVLITTGKLRLLDIDDGSDKSFLSLPGIRGTYGMFHIEESGSWTYMLDDSSPVVQALNGADHKTDSFTVFNKDQSASAIVTVEVLGQNEAPVVKVENNPPADPPPAPPPALRKPVTLFNTYDVNLPMVAGAPLNIDAVSNDKEFNDGYTLTLATVQFNNVNVVSLSTLGATITFNADTYMTLNYDASSLNLTNINFDADNKAEDTFVYQIVDQFGTFSDPEIVTIVLVKAP